MRFLSLAFVITALATSGSGANLSLTGNFTQDDNVQLIPFSISTSSAVTLRTYSYAGGTNSAGTTIKAGGFDPYLALFDSTGAFITENDDGMGLPTDPTTGLAADSLIQRTLLAGNYTLALTQFDNFAIGPNLSNGFLEMGTGNYTVAFGCTNGKFCDIEGNNRTTFWAVDLLNVSTVPEPGSAALCGLGLTAAILVLCRRRSSF